MMLSPSDGTTVYADRDLRGSILGSDTCEAQREAFDESLMDLFPTLYETPEWTDLRRAAETGADGWEGYGFCDKTEGVPRGRDADSGVDT